MHQHFEKSGFHAFPLWELSMANIPPRSQLYSLAPAGLNSSFVESLTSYICRLAQEHHIQTGALIQHIIAPCVPKQYIDESQARSISSFLRYAAPINGNGIMAFDWSKALESLTLRTDLSQLSLLIGANALSHRDLLQPVRQWCPICYNEWRCQEVAIYEPLLWFINGVTVCPKHHRLLERHCLHCTSYLPWLSWCSRPGYCSNCGKWLGGDENDSKTEEKDIYITEMVENFLTYVSRLPLPIPQTDFIQSLRNLISTTTEGNIAAFSRLVGSSKTTMWELVQGRFPPTLPFLFQLCLQFHLPLRSLLAGIEDSMPEIPALPKVLAKKRKPRRPFDRKKVQQALKEILADPHCAHLSMLGVARQLGYHARTIATHFPEESRRISQRYLEYCKQRGLQRRKHLEQRVKEAVCIVNDQGYLPTFQRVGAVLKTPGCFREVEARNAFFEAKQGSNPT